MARQHGRLGVELVQPEDIPPPPVIVTPNYEAWGPLGPLSYEQKTLNPIFIYLFDNGVIYFTGTFSSPNVGDIFGLLGLQPEDRFGTPVGGLIPEHASSPIASPNQPVTFAFYDKTDAAYYAVIERWRAYTPAT